MAKERTAVAEGDTARESPLDALDRRATREREGFDAETAVLQAERKTHVEAIKALDVKLSEVAGRRMAASTAYHAERERLTEAAP